MVKFNGCHFNMCGKFMRNIFISISNVFANKAIHVPQADSKECEIVSCWRIQVRFGDLRICDNLRRLKSINPPLPRLCSSPSCQFPPLFASYFLIKLNIHQLSCKPTFSGRNLSPCIIFTTEALTIVTSLTFKSKH